MKGSLEPGQSLASSPSVRPPVDAPTDDSGDRHASVSSPFIRRPVATTLLAVAVLLGGMLGYFGLPVSALPQVDFPTVQVTTQLPGANPETMANLVTASLERQFGQIPSLSTMTSSSSYGLSQITMQFALNRDIDGAAQDVQAAINAAGSTLPPQPALSTDLCEGEPGRQPHRDVGADVWKPSRCVR